LRVSSGSNKIHKVLKQNPQGHLVLLMSGGGGATGLRGVTGG